MSTLQLQLCVMTIWSLFVCTCGHVQDGDFKWTQMPNMMYSKSTEELVIESLTFDRMDRELCMMERVDVLWTDDSRVLHFATKTGLIDIGIPAQNKIILNHQEAMDNLCIYNHIIFAYPPEGINVTAFSLGFDYIKQQFQSYMAINFTKQSKLPNVWAIDVRIVQTCELYKISHLKQGVSTSRVFAETFYIMPDPRPERTEHSINDVVFYPERYGRVSLPLLQMTLSNIGMNSLNPSLQRIEEQTQFECECLHDNTDIIIGHNTKHSVNFSSVLLTNSSAYVEFHLHIDNFTIYDFGKYRCNVDILRAGKRSLNFRTRVVSIDPSFETLNGNMNPATFLLSESEHIYAYHDIADVYFPGRISDVQKLEEITVQLKLETHLIWIITILVVGTVLLISMNACILPVLKYRLRRKNIAQLKDLLTINRTASNPANNTSYKYDVFISHDPKDSPFVREQLLPDLERAGYRVCYGPRDFQPNRSQIFNSGDAIENSRKTIFIFSPDYYKNDWCTEMELVSVYTGILNKEGPTDRMVILLHKKCKMPDILREYTYLDWVDSDNNSFNFEKVKQALGELSCAELCDSTQLAVEVS